MLLHTNPTSQPIFIQNISYYAILPIFQNYDFLVAGDVLIEGNYETDGLSAANHDLDKLFLALQIAKNMRIDGR